MRVSESEARVPQNLRLFIAILLPNEIKAEIASVQSKFRSALPASDISWTRREQFHLTLKFLGNVSGGRVDALKDTLFATCRSSSGLRLSAEGIGFFPQAGPPRVVWAAVREESGQLGRLYDQIAEATRDFGEPEKGQTFAGHITLARVRRIKRAESETLQTVARSLEKNVFGRWTTKKIEIMRSDLTPDGAHHESIASVRLGE